ncbi:MAG: aminoacyl-tRNA deacylase [Anaerolineae bacterium]|nr:aminoacyl-tRNA deacylase [Thermoflexales bacterium]MDW8407337.1 aminoacyl-tRNA deacylase [Anaerolineae bacterium]
MPKTNAMRVLDARKVPYTVHEYSDEIRGTEGVAAALGVSESDVYKTLVVLPETAGRKPLLVIVPGPRELNLRSLAKQIGEKSLRMATHKEAEQLTGLKVGGISALALLNKGFTVYIDAAAQEHESIYVSAGQRGINLRLKVDDLIRVTGAKVVRATDES